MKVLPILKHVVVVRDGLRPMLQDPISSESAVELKSRPAGVGADESEHWNTGITIPTEGTQISGQKRSLGSCIAAFVRV